MFELDHDLAQDIVDRTMAILPYNVNVMDSQGLILGSGEPERINTRHEGRAAGIGQRPGGGDRCAGGQVPEGRTAGDQPAADARRAADRCAGHYR